MGQKCAPPPLMDCLRFINEIDPITRDASRCPKVSGVRVCLEGWRQANKGKMEREKQKEGGKNRRLRQRVNKKRGAKPKKEENGVET